jgi:hypothetical protein
VRVTPKPIGGPVFASNAWMLDPSLAKSSSAGWGFFQAAPGEYELVFSYPGITCPPATTKVFAGYETVYVGSICTAAPDAG